MTKHDIENLTRLATVANASLLPIASGGHRDSHGSQPEPEAASVSRGLLALIEAGKLAEQIRDDATKS